MTHEVLGYLNPSERRSIEGWCEEVLPLLDKYPQLKNTDLVIEGGVGTGVTMAHIARRLFPTALYVGTDIAERLMIGRGYRLSGEIDEAALGRVQAANEFPSLGMQGATVFGNCFDARLIRDIATKAGRQHPTLVSYNALNALVDRKMNPWDRKDDGDITRIPLIVDPSLPYEAQIHYGAYWEDEEDEGGRPDNFVLLEQAAQERNWTTERFEDGLLMLRSS